MAKIIGRKEEIAVLQSLDQSDRPAFVAVYGRRRVGKTLLQAAQPRLRLRMKA
jgi:uncharacterized protein